MNSEQHQVTSAQLPPAAAPTARSHRRTLLAMLALAVVAVGLAGIAYIASNTKPPIVTATCADLTADDVITIGYGADHTFTPTCATVRSGTKVIYLNHATSTLEIGADPHPIHNGNRELSAGQFVLPVAPGGEASTALNATGTFGLHDHTHPSARATIIVQ